MGDAAVRWALEGDEFRWCLTLAGWEFPRARRGEDADWITAEVDLTVETVGRFTARKAVSVLAPELVDFVGQLAELLRSNTASATLELTEGETGLTIEPGDDGESDFLVELFVLSHASPELRVRELTVSRSQVQQTHQLLRDATAAFAPRG